MLAKKIHIILDSDSKISSRPRSKKYFKFNNFLAYTRADRNLRNLINKKLSDYNITLMGWLLLNVVDNKKDIGINMSEIASNLDVTMPQANAIINQLLNQRLIRQKTQRNDRRTKHILISAKGKNLILKIDADLNLTSTEWFSAVPENYFVFYWRVVELLAQSKNIND